MLIILCCTVYQIWFLRCPLHGCHVWISEQNHLSILSLHVALTLYLIETPFNSFANRVDPDQAALLRSGSTLFAYGNMIGLILH